MQTNEFERQVQQKMDDLQIHPSEAVWQKIEPQIRKEKRRRWLLNFLPVMLIGFLYGGHLLLNNDNLYHQPQQQLSNKSIENNNTIKERKAYPDKIKNHNPVKEAEVTIVKPANEEMGSNQKINISEKIEDNRDGATTKFTHDILTKTQTQKSIVKNEKVNIDNKNPEQEKVQSDKEINAENTITPIKELPKPTVIVAATDSIEIKNENLTQEENAISNKKTKALNKYSWNLGFSFSAGSSGIGNNLFGDDQKSLADRQNASVGGSFGVVVPSTPSLIKPSLALITGITTEKNISEKFIFIAGINYKLFSTTNTVGKDSAEFFRTSNANTYHNYYHYIELPVGFKFELGDFKKSLLYWNAGLSVSQLIGAKALQYNSSRGLYYPDNSLFNKTQIGFHSGLDIAFLSKNKTSFLIGPFYTYDISKIAREGYNKHHFTFIGLRAHYLFGKNKFFMPRSYK